VNHNSVGVTQSSSYYIATFSTIDIYTFTGHYTAGTIAASPGDTLFDSAINLVSLSGGGGIANATGKITYQTTAAAGVAGTSNLDPDQSAVLTGEYYQSDLLPPISYQWYKDGSAVSGATGSTLTVYATTANATNSYEFRVTDSESRTVSAFHDVITSAGCGTQIECD